MDASLVLPYLQAQYPLYLTEVSLARDSGSMAYRATGPDGMYFFRDVKPAFSSTAQSAVDIQLFLSRKGVPVPRILPLTNGTSYTLETEADGQHLYVLYEYIEGGEPDMEQDAARVGELVGRMHTAMEGYHGLLIPRDKPFFIDRYLSLQQQMGYPEDKVEAFRRHGNLLWERVRHLPRGYCHGDLYSGNLHRAQNGALYLLDFDTSCHAFPLYDVALVCNATDYFHFREGDVTRTHQRLDRFLSGYEQFQTISQEQRTGIFDLLGVYHYQLQATIMEIYGLHCVDDAFLDSQYDWLMQWERATGR